MENVGTCAICVDMGGYERNVNSHGHVSDVGIYAWICEYVWTLWTYLNIWQAADI